VTTHDGLNEIKEMSVEEKIEALSRTNIFSSLSDAELGELCDILVLNRFEKGDRIFSEGSKGEHMYIVISGKVNISRDLRVLSREMNILLSDSDFFGEMAILDDYPRSANAIMHEEGLLLSIGKAEFRELLKRSPEFAIHIMATLAKRLRKANEDIAQLALETI